MTKKKKEIIIHGGVVSSGIEPDAFITSPVVNQAKYVLTTWNTRS